MSDITPAELEQLRAVARGLVEAADADDLVHDAWLSARSAPAARTRGWWSTVLRRRRAMQHRSQARRRVREAQADPPASPSDPSEELAQTQLGAALRGALESLSEEEQRLVVGRYCEDKSAAELASQLGVPASTVRTRLSRSLRRLRTQLDGRFGRRELWMSAAVAWSPPTTKAVVGVQGGVAVGQMMKIGAALAASVLVFGGAAWMMGEPPPSPTLPTRAAQPEPSAVAAPLEASKRAEWTQLRDAIVERQRTRKRLKPTRDDSRDDHADSERQSEVDEALREIDEALAPLRSTRMGKVLAPVLEQAVPLFIECTELLPESGTGRLHLRGNILGEPDVGAIVDTIEVVDDSLGHPEFEECLRESTYSIMIEQIGQPISDPFDIVLDMEERSLAFNAEFDADSLFELRGHDPKAWRAALENEETQNIFVGMLAQPEFAEAYPELAQALQSDLAPFEI